MGVLPDHIVKAAFEAHMSAGDVIAEAEGVESARIADVALALAHAYGEAVGLYAMQEATSDQLEALGRTAARATEGMVSAIHAKSCAGRA